MAIVRITKALTDAVGAKIRQMELTALDQLVEPSWSAYDTTHEALTEELYRIGYEKAPDLRGKIPDDWLAPPINSANLRVRTPEHEAFSDVMIEIPELPDIVLPRSAAERRFSSFFATDFSDCAPIVQEFVTSALKHKEDCVAVSARYKVLSSQVAAFLGCQPSLNRALKEMPALELYVTSNYLDRVASKPKPTVQRSTSEHAEKPKPTIDESELAAIAIAHRIATAGS